MPYQNIAQPDIIQIDSELRLVKVNEKDYCFALPWYQNPNVLYYSEGITDRVYDMEVISRMYSFLSSIGELYFIEIFEDTWKLIGDVTLSDVNMPIAIGDEKYWGRGIGKKVLRVLIKRAKELNIKTISVPAIYKHNERSKRLFLSLGFVKIGENEKEESFELKLLKHGGGYYEITRV